MWLNYPSGSVLRLSALYSRLQQPIADIGGELRKYVKGRPPLNRWYVHVLSETEKQKRRIARLISEWDEAVQVAIQATRRKEGFNQEVIAQKMGWTIDIVSNIEKGRREISVAEFIVLAEQMGVDPELMFRRIVR